MKNKLTLLAAVPLFTFAVTTQAVPVTYISADNNVSSLAGMVNSQAAAANFLSVAGALDVYDFESPVPSNLTIAGGSTVNVGSCGALCGFNTTAGGGFFRNLSGGSVSFSFTNPVDAFGFYVNGLQTDLVPQQTIEYVDGSSVTQVIDFPSATGGGGAFVGFIDFGQLIASVTFNATNDILGFDDLRFGRSATDPGGPVSVPESGSIALLGIGLLGLGMTRRKKQSSVV